MKKNLVLMLLAFLISFTISGQSQKEQKKEKALQEYQEMKALIESGEFDFQADWATTTQGRRISLTSNANFLKFSKDSLNIYLPYFGSSSSGGAAMTTDGGIVYSGPKSKFKTSFNDKKQKIIIDFSASDKNDTYEFNMSIFRGGNTLITVNSNFRTTIKYDGLTKRRKTDKK
jgi:hypothetical protein